LNHYRDVLIGLGVVVLLTAIGLFILDAMRCDPMYADGAMALGNQACRH